MTKTNKSTKAANGPGRTRNAKKIAKGQPKSRPPVSGGSRKRGGADTDKIKHVIKHGLNAFSTVHIPLPSSVGKYHTVRTVKTFTSSEYMFLFGPMRNTQLGEWWTTACGVSYTLPTEALNSTLATMWSQENPFPGTTGALIEAVPAAFSVQVASNQSLLNAAGVTYVGRLKGLFATPSSADGRTASSLADSVISYSGLRCLTNAELVSGPKQVNAIPCNTVDLSEFTQLVDDADLINTYNYAGTANRQFSGVAPIVVVNPGLGSMQITVCTEWRVRFDPFNPMHATGTLHPPTSPSIWHAITSAAESAGHGVEEVAGAGAAAYAASQTGVFAGMFDTFAGLAASALPTLAEALPLIML